MTANSDPHWFGSLAPDPDPHGDKTRIRIVFNADPQVHNTCVDMYYHLYHRRSAIFVPFFLTAQVRRLPSRAAMLTHLKNCHEEMKLEIMGEEDEEFGDPLGIVATIRSKLTLSACKLNACVNPLRLADLKSNCSKTGMDLTARAWLKLLQRILPMDLF